MKDIKQQFSEINKLPIFEVEVIETETNETEYIIFNIFIENNNFIAQHVELTTEEENSNKIAFKSIEIDEDFSLDENLQELYDECLNGIINSNIYHLKN
jgi:hypothetical protein